MRKAVTVALALSLAFAALFNALSPPRLQPPPQMEVVIAGVTIINPGIERLVDHSIVVRNGRITEVRPRRAGDPPSLCPDCFVVPGLIDAHVHTPPRIALGNQELFSLLYLAYGVTSVRDVGASDGNIAELAARLNSGQIVGPHMYRCGPVLDGDPPGWPMATVVSGPERGVAIVEQLADEGVDCIKVYNEVGLDAFESIATTAKRRGIPLIGHVPHAVGLARVSNFEAQHLTGVPYLSRPRPPIGWDIRDEDLLALSDAEVDAALAVAAARQVSFTPTLANFTLRLTAAAPQWFPPSPASHLLPEYWADAWNLIAGHPQTDAAIARRLDAVPRFRQIVGLAHERGIDILAGTDTIMPWVVPGESLHLEMEELKRALHSAEAALAAATVVNGRHIAPGEIGVITAGGRADLLLLSSDPTDRLAALREWRFVFVDGRRYERAKVDRWVEEYQRHFHGGLYATVMGTIVASAVDRFGHAQSDQQPDPESRTLSRQQ